MVGDHQIDGHQPGMRKRNVARCYHSQTTTSSAFELLLKLVPVTPIRAVGKDLVRA